MTAKEILEELLSYKELNINALATEIGLNRAQALYDIQSGKTKNITPSMADRIIQKFPEFNRVWLRTGDGEMLNTDTTLDQPMEFAPDQMDKALRVAEKMGVDLIPMYTEPFRAGNQGHNLIKEWDYVESVWAIPDTQADRLVPVEGDSMEPTIPKGSAVAISPYFFRPDEPLSIPFGDIFAIVIQPDHDNPDHLRDHIKRLYRHPDHDKHLTHWIARSDNPRYEDFEVRIDRVASLWRIKASITVQRF